jgi:hypothetical protein
VSAANDDDVTYGRAGRLRAALSYKASGIADSAASLVPTHADGYTGRGEFTTSAAAIVRDAKELLELAVAYERIRGASWEVIGTALGITRQAAHDRFTAAESRLEAEIIRCWVLGDDPRYPGLPYGAAGPAAAAAILDGWVTRRLQATDVLAHRPENDLERLHPVSWHLAPMDTLEHSTLVLAATTMISDLTGAAGNPGRDTAEIRALELGLARRKVEFYERLLADTAMGDRDPSASDLRDVLAGARLRRDELEAAETPGKG